MVCILGVSFQITNAKQLKSGDFIYQIDANGKANIQSYKGKKKNVVIPKKIGGKVVYKIGQDCFKGSGITSVKGPKTITATGYGAFDDCKKLKTVQLPGLKKMKAFSFRNCEKLTKVVISKDTKAIDGDVFKGCKNLKSLGVKKLTLRSVQYSAFEGCENLEVEIAFSKDAKEVANSAFYNCQKMKIELNENITKIGAFAFANCKGLEKIYIPKGTIAFDYDGRFLDSLDQQFWNDCDQYVFHNLQKKGFLATPFIGCTNIKEIVIDDSVKELDFENQVLFNQDHTTVVMVLAGYDGDYSFLNKVDSIGPAAFSCVQEKEITLPENLKYIGDSVFHYANVEKVNWPKDQKIIPEGTFASSSIKIMEIPEGVEQARDYAFTNCSKLEKIVIPSTFTYFQADSEFTCFQEGCVKLENFEVAKDNPVFYVQEGVLFSSENGRKTLVCYPANKSGKTYTVPKDVYVRSYAFSDLQNLKTIKVPNDTVETSGMCWLLNCKNVKLYLPKKITNFATGGHSGDFPIFRLCKNCTAYVKKNSKAAKICKKYYKYGKEYKDMYHYKIVK